MDGRSGWLQGREEDMTDVIVAMLVLAVSVAGLGFGYEIGYGQAARDSLKYNPPSQWKKALIDAEAERAKEAVR
jgi:hypothetical protein